MVEATTKYYEVREMAAPTDPEPEKPDKPDAPAVKEEGYISLVNPKTVAPDKFTVDIVGGTTTPVDGFSIFVGYKDGIRALGLQTGKFIADYVGKPPFLVFQNHPTGSPGAVTGQHAVMMIGFWTMADPSGVPMITIPSNTILGTLMFSWSKPGSYILDNATQKYGRLHRPLPAMFTRLSGRYIAPELESLTVGVPIT